MTTVLRRPLTARQPEQPAWAHKIVSPLAPPLRVQPAATTSNNNKRPRSPGADDVGNAKRVKGPFAHATVLAATNSNTATQHATNAREAKEHKDKLRQKEEREQARREFVSRYTKAFPSFVFYFDERDGGRQQAESRVVALGARIEHFFSSSVTHVITNRPQPPKNEQYDPANKENGTPRPLPSKGNLLRSPIQLKGRSAHDHGGYDKLVRDAVQLDKKIWNLSKLDSILSRLIPSTSAASKAKNGQQSTQLTQLLQHERLTGTTYERDPRERRHDYQYFSKNSHFLLVEDIRGELAPVAIMEYIPPARTVERDRTPTYPVLYMDPRARSPFVKFDEKEERRQRKLETNEKLREREKEKQRVKVKEQLKRQHEEKQRTTKTLRRCASMSQLGRRTVTYADLVDLDSDGSGNAVGLSNSLGLAGDKEAQQVASGFGLSTTDLGTGNGYLAASGNSVAITSTTTTSYTRAVGSSQRLPPSLREQLGRQVVTSRRLEGASGKEKAGLFMGEQRLRKAKSTTTMRLPMREESKKPGYCEACRVKFEDFTDHVEGARHRKFAQNPNNYMDLDFLLGRLQRKLLTDEPSETGSPPVESEGDVKLEEDAPSDACLGPGDYFYVSSQEAEAEDDWEENPGVPQIVIDEEESSR